MGELSSLSQHNTHWGISHFIDFINHQHGLNTNIKPTNFAFNWWGACFELRTFRRRAFFHAAFCCIVQRLLVAGSVFRLLLRCCLVLLLIALKTVRGCVKRFKYSISGDYLNVLLHVFKLVLKKQISTPWFDLAQSWKTKICSNFMMCNTYWSALITYYNFSFENLWLPLWTPIEV